MDLVCCDFYYVMLSEVFYLNCVSFLNLLEALAQEYQVVFVFKWSYF